MESREFRVGDTVSCSLQQIWGGEVGKDEKAIGRILSGPHYEGEEHDDQHWVVEWTQPDDLKGGENDLLPTKMLTLVEQ